MICRNFILKLKIKIIYDDKIKNRGRKKRNKFYKMIMNKSTIENGQPEQVINNELKVDDISFSASTANAFVMRRLFVRL